MKIAIIGSGISGLSLCYFLNEYGYKSTLFEKESKLGGHTNSFTIDKGIDSGLKIDTGFIVFNDTNYPNFLKLINRLKVDYDDSDMSFSYWNVNKDYGYSGKNLKGLLPDSIFDLSKIKFIYDIYSSTKKFKYYYENKLLNDDTLINHFQKYNYSSKVVDEYFLPLASAIWSSPSKNIKNWNAKFFAEFYSNHGLLDFKNRPNWKYIKNGSKSYIDKIIAHTNPEIIVNTKVKKILTAENQVKILTDNDEFIFDVVFIATHADQANSLLGDKNLKNLYKSLENWRYSNNHIYLHKDINLLPRKRKYWASWNYIENESDNNKQISISYNMNYLNKIDSKNTYIVSLNPISKPNNNQILYETYYEHPIFDINSTNTKNIINHNNGKSNVFFAGSYLGNGFHEDGVKSAQNAFNNFISVKR